GRRQAWTTLGPWRLGVLAVVALGCAVAAFRPPAPPRHRLRPGEPAGGSASRRVPEWRAILVRLPLRRVLVAVAAGVGVWWATSWPVAAVMVAGGVITVPILARGQDA